MKKWYIAATRYEGCGHQHKTVAAAKKCLPRIEKRGRTLGVYLMKPWPIKGVLVFKPQIN